MVIVPAVVGHVACGRALSSQGRRSQGPAVALQDCPEHKIAGGAKARTTLGKRAEFMTSRCDE
ncbi:MAG TPA: hypothetical protein VGJ95_13105 [Pseudonocardiaceae bacterium]|jgi:hypothetical protein